jgi:hypothetical protein
MRRFQGRVLCSVQRGNALSVLPVLLIPIVGVLALVIDGGLLVRERQHAQAVAAAALTAAIELDDNANSISSSTPDPNGLAKAEALATASANDYANDGTTSIVTVSIPPMSGTCSGTRNYVEVVVQCSQPRTFSGLWSSALMSIGTRSVARGLARGSGIGLLLLDLTMSGALSQIGNGSVSVTGSSVIVDSTSSAAVTLTGNANVTASTIEIGGYYSTSGNASLTGTVKTRVSATADPYSSISEPNPSTMTVRSSSGLSYSAGSYTLQPGVYVGGISLSGTASVTLQSGIYYLKGGGLSLSGGASLASSGVMIYNAPSSTSDGITLTGSGAVSLTPMASGPCANFVRFQDRTSGAPIRLTGSGSLSITGNILAAKAPVILTGNGTTDSYRCQIVADDASLTGTGTINLGKAGGAPGSPDMRIVQ